ncbi:hypothetical protein LTR91_021771 [Friedmanniomyces endolithicus]|uniref:RING-type domain-containing protein n=1 Tax=Friedmanniomyces endolithicus TaxID=329885 RepID=A0AAN6HC21_9PEZI|nr:hypothetical protein LTR57_010078 [Friedmanniomyces endolithicus]KAK0957625.1 hypothetical protein LTR91_021771 [Friedmanniomyces endolithicus]
MANAAMIIDISGLDDENLALMYSVKVGDFLQFRKVHSAYGYSGSVVEAVEDSGEEGDDGLEEEEEEHDAIVTSVAGSEIGREDEAGEGADEAGIEVNEDVVMTSGESGGSSDLQTEGDEKVSDAGLEADQETFVWLVPVSENGHERKVDEHAIGDEDEAGGKADVWTTSSGESDRERSTDGNDQHRNADDNASQDVLRVGEDADVGTVNESETDRGREAESNNEGVETPDVNDDENENENENEISESTLFLVRGITVYEGVIVNFDLIKLEFTELTAKPAHSYSIFGEDIVHSGAHSTTCACESSTDMIKLEDEHCLADYSIRVNPSGDAIRSVHTSNEGGICTDCNDGFVDTLADLAELVDSSIYASPALMDHQIVCPVCIGLPLLMEQQALRTTLEQISFVDLSAVVDWSGRLASRRAQLGYHYIQFDEREWGYLFDDMPPSDHDDGDDGFEQLPAEMMDPNTGVPMQPASQAAIAALPRKKFAEVENPGRAGESCLICQEEFEEGSGVVEMPCGHVFHDGECVEQWLGTVSHRCPSCRAELPVAEAEAEAGEGGEVGEGEGEEHEEDEDDDDEEDEEDDEEDDENDNEDEEDGGEGDEVQVEAEEVEEVTYSEW